MTPESYVVLYEYRIARGEERQTISFWQGRGASSLEQGTAALLATNLHNEKYRGAGSRAGEEPTKGAASCLSHILNHTLCI